MLFLGKIYASSKLSLSKKEARGRDGGFFLREMLERHESHEKRARAPTLGLNTSGLDRPGTDHRRPSMAVPE